ncbi:MAG: PEP-CTERM sorting domain-containing protein [Armatimonadota bacterium]
MKLCKALAVIIALCAVISAAQAEPVNLGPVVSKGFSELGTVAQIQPILESTYILKNPLSGATTFSGSVKSSVWSLISGDYLYLYQAYNSGPSVLQILGVTPFYNIKEVGLINSAAPTGFMDGGKTPVQIPSGSGNYAVTYDEAGGANVSFCYYAFLGGSVPTGEHTALLYLISPQAPVVADLHVTDSAVAMAKGYVTDVPEPCSLVVLGIGLAGAALRRRTQS